MKCIFFLLLIPNLLNANSNLPDSIILKNIENAVSKNIFIFRIKTTSIVDNNLHEKFIKSNAGFLKVLPDYGCKLKLKIQEAGIQYPDSLVKLYSIFKGNDEYMCDSFVLQPGFNYFSNDRYFLVGIKPNSPLKFISGNFFLNSIKDDFSLDRKQPETFYNYIKIKTFSLQTDNIQYVRKRGKKIFFEAYSNELRRKIVIIINTKDLDNFIVL